MRTVPAIQQQRYSYADYLRWPEEERWELIEGIAYGMTPSPLLEHQRIAGEMYRQLANWLIDKQCKAFIAPLDVALASPGTPPEEIFNVVEPDVFVVCDPAKLQERVMGAPDFVIEVISPSTAKKDEILKAKLYERSGVREYWIVRPTERMIEIHLLGEDARFLPITKVAGEGRRAVTVLPGFEFDLDLVFGPLPPTLPSPATAT